MEHLIHFTIFLVATLFLLGWIALLLGCMLSDPSGSSIVSWLTIVSLIGAIFSVCVMSYISGYTPRIDISFEPNQFLEEAQVEKK